MIDGEKQRLRRRMRELARQQPRRDSESHRTAILAHDAWKRASTVLLYAPLTEEPDPTLLIAHREFRDLLFPRIEGEHLGLYRHREACRWIVSSLGLQEPDPASWERASPSEVDLALVPGLAFDPAGGRLGRGRGYYDLLLGNPDFRGIKIGLCWSWQIVPAVPRDRHDILMDQVITEVTTHTGC